MQLICPRCHTNNRFGAERPAAPARFVCVGCREEFEAVLVGGALRTVAPQDAHALAPFAESAQAAPAPEEDFFDILSIPQEPPAEVFAEAAPAQVLEDLFDAAPAAREAAQATADVPAPAAEVDPYQVAGPVAERLASPPAAHEQAEAAAEAVAEVAPPAEAAFAVEAAAAEVPPSSSGRVPPPPPPASVDKYAVGMRVLRVSPLWLLLSSLGFFAVLLTLSWMSQPVGPVGEAVAAAGMKMPNQASSPPLKAAPAAAVEEAKATAEEAKAPAEKAPQPAAKPAPAAPAPQPAAAEQTPAGAPGGKFTVQVGSFNDPSEANQRVSQLRAAGFEARSVTVELPQRGTWYRVQAGRFATREDAAKAGAQMRAKGAAAAVMVTEVN
jgi:SPOR domain